MDEKLLLELAERCEKEEPTFALDVAIALAAGGYDPASATTGHISEGIVWRGNAGFKPPPYTTSLDAAVTLVPEGWHWAAGTNRLAHVYGGAIQRSSRAVMASVPLALCAASLRAMAAGASLRRPSAGANKTHAS